MIREEYDQLSKIIMESCIEVYQEMGPCLMESVYQACLLKELELRGVSAEGEVKIPLIYEKNQSSKEFLVDIMVEKEIILEIKTVEPLLPVHEAQTISYLKLADKKSGFRVNFNVPLLKDGFKRDVNNF